MIALLMIIHVTVCLFLIAVVLLQSGKGAEMGAAFGGSSQTIFGSRGAATFLSKLTTISAVVFMLTSLGLAMVSVRSGSVVKKTSTMEQKAQPKPFQPASGPQGPLQAPQPAQPLPPQK